MCGPLALSVLSFGVGAAQQVFQFVGQRQQAKSEREAATAAYEQDQQTASLRQIQEQDAAAQQSYQQSLSEAEAKAEVRVQAAGAGVGGLSVSNLLDDIGRRAARNREVISQNTKATIQQVQLQKKGSQAQAQSRVNAAPNPSPFGLVAGLAGSALSSVNTYNRNKYMMT